MVTNTRTEPFPYASLECVTENVTVPDSVIAHVIIRPVFEFDVETKDVQESLVQAVSGDCKGRDD